MEQRLRVNKPDIKAITVNPDIDVIDLLEDVLKDAKTGKIQSVAVVISCGNYKTGNAYAGMNKNNMAMVGEVAALQQDLVNLFVELRSDTE
jgi:hypothetical protein